MHLFRYLDDWLVVVELRELLLHHRNLFLQLCTDLGIVVNWEKSDLQLSSSSVPRHAGISIAGTSGSLPGSGVFVPAPSITSSSDVAVASWPHGLLGAVSPVAAQRQLVFDGGRSSQSDPLVAGLRRSSEVVALGGQMDVTSSTARSAPILLIVYRRVPIRLWGPSTRSDGLGGLVRGGFPGAHQCAGSESSTTGSSCLLASVVGADYRPYERQCVSCRLSPASRRHSVSAGCA